MTYIEETPEDLAFWDELDHVIATGFTVDGKASYPVQEIAQYRAQSTERMSNTILAMLGNVNHDTPGGSNAAAMRGGMLEDIRKYLTSQGEAE